jgi:hypothetical protein
MPVHRSKKTKSSKSPSSEKQSTRDRSFQVLQDMARHPSLDFTQAARNRNIDPRTVLKHVGSALQRNSSGRIKPRPSDNLRQTLYIPSAEPGETISVPTSNSFERQLLGKWMEALNRAGRGDFSEIRAFPSGLSIGGVALPTSDDEIQAILEVLAEGETPFEGLYRTIARPS